MAEAFKKSDVEILVATMHRCSLDFLVSMFPLGAFYNYNILVVNQTTVDNILDSEYPTVRVLNVYDKGLSKSRNLAIENAVGKLCVITDDDVVFADNFDNLITNAFNAHKSAAIISFRAERAPGVLYKSYPEEHTIVAGQISRLGIMSIEMVINRALVSARFNENFGLGAHFGMGEEAVFINDVYKNGGKILLEPRVIVRHTDKDTHQKIDVYTKYYIHGAICTNIFRHTYLLWVFLKLRYELKTGQLRFTKVSLALNAAFKGRRDYKKLLNENNT